MRLKLAAAHPAWVRRVAALFLSMVLACAIARAGEQALPVGLQVNGGARGSIAVILRAEDILVAKADLDGAGIVGLGGVQEQIGGHTFVSLKSLAPRVSYKLNEVDIQLELTLPVENLAPSTIEGTHSAARILAPDRAQRSAHLNYAWTQSNTQPNSLAYETGVNIGSGILISDAVLGAQGTGGPAHARLQFDDLPHMRRVAVGSTYADTSDWSGLGGRINLNGIMLGREYSLDPTQVHGALFGRLTGTVGSPTIAELYVNGALVLRQELAPGPFSIENLPLQAGGNSAKLILRDAFGRTQVIDQAFFGSGQMLRGGDHDYQFALGKPTIENADVGAGPLALVSRYRLGVTSNLTLGAQSAFGRSLQNEGLTFGYASRFGEFDGAFATSRARASLGTLLPAGDGSSLFSGHAGALAYSFSSRRFSAGYTYMHRSPYYGSLANAIADDRALLQSLASTTISLTRNISLNAAVRTSNYRDAPRERESIAGLTFGSAHLGSLSISLGQRLVGTALAPVSLFQYTLAGRSNQFSVLSSNESGTGNRTVQYLRQLQPWEPGIAYNVQQTKSGGATAMNSALLDYRDQHFDLSSYANGGKDQGQSQTYTLAGALTLVDKTISLSRPVEAGFALVDADGVRGLPVTVNNHEAGRTNSSGRLLVSDLTAYEANEVRVDLANAPTDYLFESSKAAVAPGYLGGVRVHFPARIVRAFTGTILIDSPQGPLVPANGRLTLTRSGKTLTSDLGSDGRFFLDNAGPGTYDASVDSLSGGCRLTLELQVPDKAVTPLGTIHCSLQQKAT